MEYDVASIKNKVDQYVLLRRKTQNGVIRARDTKSRFNT